MPAEKKTCERTKGAAKAVQAMHGDSLSANRVQDDPKSSTTFCVKPEPPALPCSDDVSVENGAAAPKPCPLRCLEMHSPIAALLPTDEASTMTRITCVFGSVQPRGRILRGRQLNAPCITVVSGGTSFPPPSGGGLYKQNQGTPWYSIQSVLKVVSVTVRFWKHDARCFVGRL